MGLVFYNTATQKKEPFKPITDGQVKMYACGPTVYDYFHIGNGRAFVVFDTVRRLLKTRGYQVTYVQNVTDIDDKIINRANEEGISAAALADKYAKAFFEDVTALGCKRADQAPKATEHMTEIIDLVQRIIDKGHAYAVDGDVFFAVRSFAHYGKLSGKKIDELNQGARVEVDTRKKDPLDFALWKSAKPGEPSWDSPWGKGRPGWHIECSAMSMKYLGEQFDIHGGGEDLVFPHHENENAQSESVTGKPLARYWLHNGHLKIEGEKMSKSLGNFWVARDVLKKYPRQVVRLFLLSAHYRSPLDFSAEGVDTIQKGYEELQHTLGHLKDFLSLASALALSDADDPDADAFLASCNDIQQKYDEFLDDDLNTAGAIGQIHTLASAIKNTSAKWQKVMTKKKAQALNKAKDILLDLLGTLGITDIPYRQKTHQEILTLDQITKERQKKEWAKADEKKKELRDTGWILQDTFLGTTANSTHGNASSFFKKDDWTDAANSTRVVNKHSSAGNTVIIQGDQPSAGDSR